MRKVLLIIICLFILTGWVKAQVLADFEKDTNGFADNGWGKAFTSVQKVADPSGKSTGVLELSYDGSKGDKGDIQADNIDVKNAQLITFFVWLPVGMPDGMAIKTWGQDGKNWIWQDNFYDVKNIPKGVWYPLNFYIKQSNIKDAKFDVYASKLGKMGLEVAVGNAANKTWVGKIYVDNVTLIGAEPSVIADFENDIQNYKQLWGSFASVTQVTDPSAKSKGVAALQVNKSGGAFGLEATTDGSKANLLVIWIWLPTAMPDDAVFKVFAQDNKDWAWNSSYYTGNQIPKEVWYPIYFDMAATQATPGSKFDHVANKIGKFGLDFGTTTFAGTFYVDNVSFVSSATGKKWVISNFEAPAAGTQGFTIPSWAKAMTSIERSTEDNGNGVLKGNLDFTKDVKGVIQKDNVNLYSTETSTAATDILFDIYIPADMPLGAELGFVLNGAATNYAWTEIKHFLNDKPDSGNATRGKWNTMRINVADLVKKGIADPQKSAQIFVQVYYSTAQTWKGSVLFDNLTLVGIPEPKGTVVSPKTTAKVVSFTLQTGGTYEYVRFDWIDNKLGSETYNIYVSEKPITDLKAAGVVKFASEIPHGLQKYGHRPWTTDGSKKNYYYAITAFDGINETPLTDDSRVGPISVQTTTTFKAQYVSDFSKKFVLDGVDGEFQNYVGNQILPESAGDEQGPKWNSQSTDMNFRATLVIDDKYLYISAVVTDDDLRNDPAAQAWEGDALEFYMGFYDSKVLKELHPKNSPKTKGDWRIGFNSDGKTTLDGLGPSTVPGIQSAVFQKFTGDGYIIEAKLALDSVAENSKFKLTNGMMMPLRIDGNDQDPSKGDTKRTLIIQAGGMPSNNEVDLDESWKRPATWGYLEVVGAPITDVANESKLPTEFALYNNYPNPFNPTTKIKYDLPKESEVILKVYDILGREVATLVDMKQAAGYYEVSFNAANLATGVYIYRISTGGFVQSKKMLLVK